MATTMRVQVGDWNELFGIWFQVRPDPLTDTGTVLVTVHCQGADLWINVQGPNGGARFQTVPPDQAEQEHS